MRGLIKWFTVAAIVVTLVLSPLAGNWAQAGDGAGDGSGGGQNNPLVIESSTPANGAAGVASLEDIKIVFSKNVVYMTVRDKNLQCFTLWAGSQRIPTEVIMADDQIEREKRNDVLIKPKQPLQAGTTYRVEIAPELQSKSGVTLGQKAVITFTMAGGAKVPEAVTPDKGQPAAPDTPTGNQPDTGSAPSTGTTNPDHAGISATSPAVTATDTTAATPAAADSQPEATSPDSSNSNTKLWVALGVVGLAVATGAYRRMGTKK